MNDFERAKEYLNTILKKGDLYDAIAIRERVKAPKHSFLRNHLLLFSRILYGGLCLVDKVKSLFSPVEEVKRAQDKLREIIGVNVDFIKTKHVFDVYNDMVSDLSENMSEEDKIEKMFLKYDRSTSPVLSILYSNSNINIEEYIDHLRKILTFCELHHIKDVFLRKSDISNLSYNLDLDVYSCTTMKKILDCTYTQMANEEDIYDVNERLSDSFLELKIKELRELIKRLETIKISKKKIYELAGKIEDTIVKSAIADFIESNDLEKLREIVRIRLELLINSDSSYKDRENGKVFRNVTIKNEFINIISTDKKGKVISNIVTTLYDFIGVLDYASILKQTQLKGDDHELFAMISLHLYLCQSIKISKSSSKGSISFYDSIYNYFKEKQKGKMKKIPGLYTKRDKHSKSISHMFSSYIITFFLLFTIMLAGGTIDFIAQIAFKNESCDVLNNMFNMILEPYSKSYNLEQNIVNQFFNFAENARNDLANFIKTVNGDVSEDVIEDDRILAYVNTYDGFTAPTYFATGYAQTATYKSGHVEYPITSSMLDCYKLYDTENVLDISIFISKDLLNEYTKGSELNFPKLLYPIGSGFSSTDYVLTEICICDDDESKRIIIDNYRVSFMGNKLTDVEMNMIQSIEKPKIICVYGIEYGINPFVEDIKKTGTYTQSTPEEIRDSIIKGLGLDKDASDMQIFKAIASKDYSTTPLKDAGLSWKIKWLDEKKYFETIASMDSLVCNLAATLAVGTDEELIYTVGYVNYNDNLIRANEAHAWAMSKDGDIIDVTPTADSSKSEEENVMIQKLIEWGIEHNIPIYMLIALVGYAINKSFGQKVRFKLEIRKVKKILTRNDIEASYAKLKDNIYGGLNIPCKRSPIELAETIRKEFGGFTEEEVKKIKEGLLKSGNYSEELDSALKLLQEVPFMLDNFSDINKVLRKK